ncbi:MAG: hypothetical protein J2P37_35560, partial [Ktedonobacteraceae bacterium]|nr:hypothetical protein [Ktedonobacteraceae bacterium]
MQPHLSWSTPATLTISWSQGISRLLLPLDSLQELEVTDTCFALAPHGQAIARLHEDQVLRVHPLLPNWKIAGSPAFACQGSMDARTIRTLAWSPDHRLLLALLSTGACTLFVAMEHSRLRGHIRTCFPCPSLPAGKGAVPLAFAPRSQAVAIAQHNTVGIWDNRSGEQMAQLG